MKIQLTKFAYWGKKESQQVAEAMESAAFLVMPSEWYEGFPMTIVEALSKGLPVIASNLGSMAEIIGEEKVGILFNPGDAEDLAKKVRWALEHPEQMRFMGLKARLLYEKRYTSKINYGQLISIYKRAILENQGNTIDTVSKK